MASEDQKTVPGGHYSGANPIPNIQKFVESLDADKKERDRRINEGLTSGEIKDHVVPKAGVAGISRNSSRASTRIRKNGIGGSTKA